ncbi:MAG: alkylhydroperoxidase domain protein [Thermomicrobiales bacterium]|nr:MAG: alkylhydroperoxidase domain protein [Thermomicrobiales bacterium]
MTEPAFTLDFLNWVPWVPRAVDGDLSPERTQELESFVAGKNASDYLLVLANDFDSLEARAVVHRHVYVDEADVTQAGYRELGATTTSRINGCVFCASVHARHVASYLKDRPMALRLLSEGIDTDLPPIERAVVDASAKLTCNPEGLIGADLSPMRALGLNDLEILDILNYAAFFANANRLMLTLGEPEAQPKLR